MEIIIYKAFLTGGKEKILDKEKKKKKKPPPPNSSYI